MPRKHRPPISDDYNGERPDSDSLDDVIERAETASPGLADLVADENADPAELDERLKGEKARRPDTFYSGLIFALSGLRYNEAEARILWGDLLNHKVEMSSKLGRNVGIQVAALDFFKNIVGQLDRVHFVDPQQYLQTARLAITDGLTGLFNHRYFQERLRQALRRAEENQKPLSLLMIDIDHFKVYNDLNGHIAGDVALREVAETIRRTAFAPPLISCPHNDVDCEWNGISTPAPGHSCHHDGETCPFCGLSISSDTNVHACRYGGEEFAVVIFDAPKEDASVLAEGIRYNVERAGFPNQDLLPGHNLSVSIGVSEFPEDAHDPNGLITYADRALYVAKRSGRNRVCSVVGDRRLFERIAYETPVKYKAAGGSHMAQAHCSNISAGGMSIRGENIPDPGAIIRVFLPGLEDDPFVGKVIWRETRGGVFVGGVRFVALDRQQEGLIKDVVGI